jgi:hypothetical protein
MPLIVLLVPNLQIAVCQAPAWQNDRKLELPRPGSLTGSLGTSQIGARASARLYWASRYQALLQVSPSRAWLAGITKLELGNETTKKSAREKEAHAQYPMPARFMLN